MVLVCGDSATDQIIEINKLDSPHVHTDTITVHERPAFAKQLYEIIKDYYDKKKIEVHDFSSDPLFFTISKWKEHTVSENDKNDNNRHLFFDEHIGTQRILAPSQCVKNWDEIKKNSSNKKIAAICDIYNSDELYFYNYLAEYDWIVVRTLLQENKASNLLEKLGDDKQIKKKTIVILHSADLRKAGFEIKKGVSWEQIIIETYEVLSKEPWNKFAYLIVCFEHEGALLIDNNKNNYTALFYANEIEGDYLKNRPKVFGMLNTFHAAIIIRLYNLNKDDDIMQTLEKASKAGIGAMRKLISNGLLVDKSIYQNKVIKFPNKDIKYPHEIINSDILKSTEDNWDDETIVTLPLRNINNNITIVGETCKKDINELYEEIVEKGINKALKNIPVLKYENLLSVDCNEIKSYRKIHNLFESYIKNKEIFDKPLSVCVFGAPGTGKSFGITEIIKHIKNEQRSNIQTLHFNLSQFHEDDLSSAFNQIRNVNLDGELPIVFWDEFDCDLGNQELGWLKLFLGPMQDGKYYEKGNKYTIGRVIFIFAGGVYRNSQKIINDSKKDEKIKCKLPDFLSRIAGNYLDVYSLNQEERELKLSSKDNEMYKIRRAVIIRKLAEKYLKVPEDYELTVSNKEKLIKLLKRETYDYGIRTLENEIIDLFVNNA